jgi:hypothetical protein
MSAATATKRNDFAAIEERRRKYDISIDALCRAAALSSRHYYYLLAGQSVARPDTVRRLARALEAARSGK